MDDMKFPPLGEAIYSGSSTLSWIEVSSFLYRDGAARSSALIAGIKEVAGGRLKILLIGISGV
ncbi:hypothetical protein OIE13_21075 [Streptosporangium sp. NBC_01810]|uniref:hypothetical protein n=1 Tax=Streptosporangium sp. NBC_01810 TaxID=2975951 RepID=UPI002DDADA4C|nr:hypothetical protein [Streptosporangium sp. NBC_01810]WSA23452.1 hypothetical protein OIE13_21075 [Streptosporangium sp. NBC_01810]